MRKNPFRKAREARERRFQGEAARERAAITSALRRLTAASERLERLCGNSLHTEHGLLLKDVREVTNRAVILRYRIDRAMKQDR